MIRIEDLPEEVRSAIATEAADHPILQIETYSLVGGALFEVGWLEAGLSRAVVVSSEGRVVARFSEPQRKATA